jgi:hypothetical protein
MRLLVVREVRKIEVHKDFLLRVHLTRRREVTQEPVFVKDSMFKSDPDNIEEMEFNSGLYDTDIVIS